MFHWICPECGREIAPTVRECPACDAGAEKGELVLAGVVEASARTAHDEAWAIDRNGTQAHSAPAPVKDSANGVLPSNGDLSLHSAGGDEPPSTDAAVALLSLGTLIEASQESSSPVADAPLIPEILDAKAVEIGVVQARAAEILGVRAGIVEAQTPEAHEARAVESKAVPTRTVESKATETRPVEGRAVEAKLLESRTVVSKAIEAPAAESKAAGKVVESRAASAALPPVKTQMQPDSIRTAMGKEAAKQSIDEDPRQAAPPVTPGSAERMPLLAKFGRLTPLGSRAASKAETIAGLKSGANAEAQPDAGAEASSGTKSDAGALVNAAESTVANIVAKIAVNTDIAPQAAAHEPVLPSLVPLAPSSLNALLAATGMLEDEASAEPPDPPISAKLPLPLRPARVTPAALAALLLPASKAQPSPPPEAAREQRIAGLALAGSPLPLGPIAARPMAAAVRSQPAALPPKSAGVRAPRSARPFPAPGKAPLVRYSPLENHPLRPAPPPEDLRRTQTAPRFTLPGPMLTRSLASFQDRALTPVFLEERAFRKRFPSGWLVTVLVLGTVLGVGFSSLLSVTPHPNAETRPAAVSGQTSPDAASATDPASAAGTTAPATARASGSNPLSKSIEVTGFRLVMDPSRKAEVQYLVVNHSPARFSDATVFVTLHAANARPGQPPLCRFSFAAPNLGPFEAKEMISAIEKTNRPVNLPDWQALRADIEIGK